MPHGANPLETNLRAFGRVAGSDRGQSQNLLLRLL
jgi:hypothetical protein